MPKTEHTKNSPIFTARFYLTAFFTVGWTAVYYPYVIKLSLLSLKHATYSHIIVVPATSAFFMFSDRKKIFSNDRSSDFRIPLLIFTASISLMSWLAGHLLRNNISENDYLFFMATSALMALYSCFLMAPTRFSPRSASFPFLLLIFAVPIPDIVLESIIKYLIWGSSHVTEAFFKVLGVPYLRNGPYFVLPGIKIEVAKECSGIRSSIGMTLTVLMASHIFLRRFWSKCFMVLIILPFVLIKNGIRITTLTLLAIHVDERYLTGGFLHSSGGVVFFVLTLALIIPIVGALRKVEASKVRDERSRLP